MESAGEEAERKSFMAKLKDYMEKRGTPIDRIPQLGQREVDLYKLYQEVTKRGGLNEVVSNKGMKEVAAAFNFPSTCTNAGFALRVHYLKFLFPYERRFFHNLDDDAMVPKRPVGRPRNEERMMRDDGKVREPIAQAYGPGTRRSTRRAASEAAARTSAAIAGERGITGPVGVSSTSFSSLGSSNSSGITTRSALILRSAQDIMPQDYARTAIPKANNRLKAAWASYHPALRLIVLTLESESAPAEQVDWALGTLLVLSFEEQLHLNAIPLTGLLDSLLRHSRPYNSFLLRVLGAEHEHDDNDGSEDDDSDSDSEFDVSIDSGGDDVAPTAPTKAERQRGTKVWEIIRNLSCIPENEGTLAEHGRLVRTAVRLMALESRFGQYQQQRRRRDGTTTTTVIKRAWVERLSRNALDVYSSVCHHLALAGSKSVARAAPALAYFIDRATDMRVGDGAEVDEAVWTAVEALRKLTHEGDNEIRLLPFVDSLLDSFARLLCMRDGGDEAEADSDGDEESENDAELRRRTRESGTERESEVSELKGAALAVLLNMAKYSPRTACRLPAHPGLMRRLFGLVSAPSEADDDSSEGAEAEEEGGEAEAAEVEVEVEEESRMEEDDNEEDDNEEEEADASVTLTIGEQEDEMMKALLKSVEDEEEDDNDNDEERSAKRQKVDASDVSTEAKNPSATTDTSAPMAAGQQTETPTPVSGATKDAAQDEGTAATTNSETGSSEEAATARLSAEKIAATAASDGSADAAAVNGGSGGAKRKREDGEGVERAREKLRKQAGLVLSKMADDPTCCDALRVYDGLVVQAMLLAPLQGPLASLAHKVMLNIGLAAVSP